MSDACSKKTCSGRGAACGGPDAKQAQQNLAIRSALDKIRHKILVMSGKGGVGKSTVAVNLAIGLARKGYRVGLMDVDLHGPDICRMLGLTGGLTEPRSKAGKIPPLRYNDMLKVVSLETMLENRDDPIIWRGPLKNQAIRQFIADVDWGELDYLVIDAPPGTGDEPMAVANTIKEALALVVTTPQEIALADVRKSINFCRHVKMEVLGVVENMSGFICPHCNTAVDIFKTGGGEELAATFDVSFLGRIPLDPVVVTAGDSGRPSLGAGSDSPAALAFEAVLAKVEKAMPAKAKRILPSVSAGCGCEGGVCNPSTCTC